MQVLQIVHDFYVGTDIRRMYDTNLVNSDKIALSIELPEEDEEDETTC